MKNKLTEIPVSRIGVRAGGKGAVGFEEGGEEFACAGDDAGDPRGASRSAARGRRGLFAIGRGAKVRRGGRRRSPAAEYLIRATNPRDGGHERARERKRIKERAEVIIYNCEG